MNALTALLCLHDWNHSAFRDGPFAGSYVRLDRCRHCGREKISAAFKVGGLWGDGCPTERTVEDSCRSGEIVW